MTVSHRSCSPGRPRCRAPWRTLVGLILIAWLVGSPHVFGRELIDDGGFENGAELWDSEAQGDGEWYLDRVGSFTPVSGMPTSDQGPGQGNYVVSDQEGATTLALFQKFTVPRDATSVVLSYDMFVNDWSNKPSFDPTQYARVDILTGDASPLDIGEGVLVNLFVGTDGGPLPNPFSHRQFDITPWVGSGGEFQVRFLAGNSFQNMNQGVDNVSIRMVPEPNTWILALAAMALWAAWFPWFRHP